MSGSGTCGWWPSGPAACRVDPPGRGPDVAPPRSRDVSWPCLGANAGSPRARRRRSAIRRSAAILTVLAAYLLAARDTSAAPSLALPGSDYPHGATVTILPATNSLVDQYLEPAHRSSFEQLHRVDGSGWLQFASWGFKTGRGGAAQTHNTIFGYGINLFHGAGQAARALSDVKLKTRPFKVARLPALFYRSSDVNETLVFVFFAYKAVEVEVYYEYNGVAPAGIASQLRRFFGRQRSHLAARARTLSRTLRATTTPTATPLPTSTNTPEPASTATATETPAAAATDTPQPTSTSPPAATATSTATSTPLPTPALTATPLALMITASIENGTHSPGKPAVMDAQVTSNSQPISGVSVEAIFFFPSGGESCQTTSDANGTASCSVSIPNAPHGWRVEVDVHAFVAGSASTTTIFFSVD
jgi:hypothetical protein